jgi:DNA mismatch repair protein MutL
MPVLRVLPESTVNRIAAGEVVERPASAFKELVENALDAGARRIDIALDGGGRDRIAVADDGIGMGPEELALAVERHATSKLPDDDLVHIRTLGFRGEALPSIGSVARLTIASRKAGAGEAWRIAVTGGAKEPVEPAAHGSGTRVEVRDLFYATPARLKFLKSERAERDAALDAVRRLAMAHPEVAFTVTDNGKQVLNLPAEAGEGEEARRNRLARILGRDFGDNSVPVAAEREGFRLAGFAGLPTFSRATAAMQFLFVGGRPVRDKLLIGCVRAAYQDLMAHDRHAAVALFLDCDPEFVDVNVHPAKAEVRFRDAGLVRGLVIGALRNGLAQAGHRAATSGTDAAMAAFRPGGTGAARPMYRPQSFAPGLAEAAVLYHALADRSAQLPGFGEAAPVAFEPAPATVEPEPVEAASYPLGLARAQLHNTYILAETADGFVLVDQHAAHERLTHERIRRALANGGVSRQMLLLPEVVDLDEASAARLLAQAEELAELGFGIEPFGPGAVVVREVPSLLGTGDVAALVRDLADELASFDEGLALRGRLDEVCATLACHTSVRAGRKLAPEEMNALLREMEATPLSGQCSHGRPTYIELKRADIERLFGRR